MFILLHQIQIQNPLLSLSFPALLYHFAGVLLVKMDTQNMSDAMTFVFFLNGFESNGTAALRLSSGALKARELLLLTRNLFDIGLCGCSGDPAARTSIES